MQSKRENSPKAFAFLVLFFILIGVSIYVLLHAKAQENRENTSPTTEVFAPILTSNTLSIDSLSWAKQQPGFLHPNYSLNDTIIQHGGFCLLYNEEWEQARWVAWELHKNRGKTIAERSSSFYSDPLILSQSAHPNDYKNSGYDRGHLAPAADFSHDGVMMKESFYMSNMSPQAPSFNRGVWKKLEEKTREWAEKNEHLYLVAGPLMLSEVQKIGSNEVYVPTHYFKIIADLDTPSMKILAFLFPNRKVEQDLNTFQVPVDSVEKVSGLNFFPLLPDSLEHALEEELSAYDSW